jgi:pyridinium-3,5-biscarboxylic acid mononucleotide sulfurtransferase
MPGARELEDRVREYESLLVGYSGGVDSALVAVTACQTLGPARVVAALGVSASLSTEQYDQAHDVARRFAIPLVDIATDEFGDPNYVRNQPKRCFHCKSELWTKLAGVARERGLSVVVDGTNADDVVGHRPGARAAREHGVRSPLMEAGFTKAMVREEARRLGIPIWNVPAAPCLSSRIAYGLAVTPNRVDQVARGERYLRTLGVGGDLRVRHHGGEARIEVHDSEFDRLRTRRGDIAAAFRALGFEEVTLDLRGYRSGSLLDSNNPVRESLVGPE